MWHFIVPGQPFAKQRPRVVRTNAGFSRTYTPAQTENYENLIRMAFVQEYGHPVPLTDPLELTVVAYFQIPKSFSKKKVERAEVGLIGGAAKPDWDNIGKIVCDALNKIAFHDDAQVIEGRVIKLYSVRPRVEVTIRPWSGGAAEMEGDYEGSRT